MMPGKKGTGLGTVRSRFSASSALAIGFSGILLVSSIIGILISGSLARRLESEVSARNQLLAVTLANDMATFLDGYRLALHLAGSESFWTQDAAETLSQLYPAFSSVMLVNTSGQVEFASMSSRERFFDVSNRDFYIATRQSGQPYISPSFIAEGDYAPTAVLAVPGGKGLAVASLNLKAIGEYIMGLPIQGAETIAIVDHHGYYIAHRDPGLVANRSSVSLESWYRDDANLVAGSRRVLNLGAPERLICWAPVPGLSGWTVVVSEDADSVFAQPRLLRLSTSLTVGGISFAAMILIIFTLRLLDRDIRSLYRHATAVANGNYDTTLHYQGFKDLAPLAEGYREAMIAVKEREKRIQENERRLEGILDFMPIPVLIMDRQESVFHINHAVTRTFGWTSSELPDLSTWWLRMYPDQANREMAQQHWAGHPVWWQRAARPFRRRTGLPGWNGKESDR
jgi:PAS domain S-box-containing protein